MKINSNINTLNLYANKFNENAKNIAEGKNIAKNLVEENINVKTFEAQTEPVKTQDKMLKSLFDIKA